eukprot:scaffold180_cov311-Pinguiococcus_pyrenoidosus.AAC.19
MGSSLQGSSSFFYERIAVEERVGRASCLKGLMDWMNALQADRRGTASGEENSRCSDAECCVAGVHAESSARESRSTTAGPGFCGSHHED